MAWIDDRIWCHEKFTDLSGDAFAAYVKGVAYSSGMMTRGHLTRGQMKLVGARAREIKALLDAGLWELNGAGVVIHDWDEHNGKRDERREKERERKRQARGTWASSGARRGAGQAQDE